MKKLAAVLLLVVLAFSMVACNDTTPDYTTKSEGVMTYAEYMSAKVGDDVVAEFFVQDTQSWWADTICVYGADPDGAYFAYKMKCSQADSKKLVPGTKIRVTGKMYEYAGELEFAEGCTFEFVGGDGYIAPAKDLTNKLANEEELIKHMNQLATFKGMTVVSRAYDGNNQRGDDIKLELSLDGETYTFYVESYHRGADTDVYKAVEALKPGDVIDVTGYAYWWNGINTHITEVVKK